MTRLGNKPVADYEYIERQPDLRALAKDLPRQPVVAVDTEADSFYHYFDKTCLVQVAIPGAIYLIDPIALGGPAELAPLGAVMASKKTRKVFHAAEYDLFVLKRDCGFQVRNLFDTMLSAQLLGYPSVGLAALAHRHFGVTLPKDEQRSDWSMRPLRESQLTYAAADVMHLIELAERLEAELRERGRLTWAHEEFEALAGREWPAREFDALGYLRIKGARALDAHGLSALRELYLMRDARARDVDRPPFKVVGNRALLEIAERRPRTMSELARIKGISELILKRLGQEILDALARAERSPHGPVPRNESPGRRRMDRRAERRMERLKRWRAVRARELELDPGVLCPNSTLETIAWRNSGTIGDLAAIPEVKGWLAREFGAELIRALREPEEARPTETPPGTLE
jgi:ribonuclease D